MGNGKRLNLEFKGSRNYIQGPDIYNAVLAMLEVEANEQLFAIDFAFHRMASSNLEMFAGDPPEGGDPVAVCVFTVSGKKERVYVLEIDEPIAGRRPYPEDEIIRGLDIDLDARSCSLLGTPSYSDIEVWVAMTKALHQKAFPELKGKWLFVRGRFDKYERASASTDRRLVIKACFNNKLTRSEAILSGEKVGDIFFSIV